jgi:monofunctional biosynthetic peptidoglycan transglycosylase
MTLRIVGFLLVALVAIPLALVALYRAVPPPLTPLMALRTMGYEATPKLPPLAGWHYHWVPLARIAPSLPRAVIAAEDTTFCSHNGFDREAFNRAWEKYQAGEPTRGGSTITQQTAKNALLWPGRNAIRKVIETALTPAIEMIWGKRRIMEVYLNIVEWAPGVYGAEAAAQFHFHKSASALTQNESALLAAVLPNPRKWSASKPGPYVLSRVPTITTRMTQVSAACVR